MTPKRLGQFFLVCMSKLTGVINTAYCTMYKELASYWFTKCLGISGHSLVGTWPLGSSGCYEYNSCLNVWPRQRDDNLRRHEIILFTTTFRRCTLFHFFFYKAKGNAGGDVEGWRRRIWLNVPSSFNQRHNFCRFYFLKVSVIYAINLWKVRLYLRTK